ncbi:MAG: hypothetical protein AAGI17_11005 [Planctomycetota bacterium]
MSDDQVRIYDGDAGALLEADTEQSQVSLLPSGRREPDPSGNIRILWGQSMLADVVGGRYRAVICGVNEEDNESGIIAQLVERVPSSQWTAAGVTSYAKMFQQSVGVHAAHDKQPYVLKYDLDRLMIFALLRPSGQSFFTLDDLAAGFGTISKMLAGRAERLPVCSVSFLGARSNRLVQSPGNDDEPSFESVLRGMHESGFRGDVYPSPSMWEKGHVGVFASYPFPAGLDRMREGSS